jgi:hypothetical protein
MLEQPLFFLVLLEDCILISHWTFRADDELEVMRQLLRDSWKNDRLFKALRIDRRKIDEVSPEELLRAINDMSDYPTTRMVRYLMRVAPSGIFQVNPENERATV